MTYLSELHSTVENGAHFSINFETRTARVGKTTVIKDGVPAKPLGETKEPIETVMANIEKLYRDYKYSIPSERNDARRKRYFKALEEHELPDEVLLYGTPREVAQFRLEMYVLTCIINRTLTWDNDILKGWFWKSQEDKDLIIFKSWITPKC